MTFAQRRNRLTTHFSDRIPVVKRRICVHGLPISASEQAGWHSPYCDHGLGWKIRSSNLVTGNRFSFLQNTQTGSGTHTASYSMDTVVLSRGLRGRSLKITRPHLQPRLRTQGIIPPLPLNAFMAWTATTLSLRLH